MDSLLLQPLAVLIAYLIGSIPFGFLLTKFVAKKDIQALGSGNIGATNVTRVAGKTLGRATFVLDGLKGLVAVYLCFSLFALSSVWLKNMVMMAVVLGHIYPVWLRFRGGKGVATFIVMSAYTSPLMFVMMLVSWYGFYKMFYIVSLASVVAMISVFAYQVSFFDDYFFASIFLASFIIYKHKDNMRRLVAGQETSFK